MESKNSPEPAAVVASGLGVVALVLWARADALTAWAVAHGWAVAGPTLTIPGRIAAVVAVAAVVGGAAVAVWATAVWRGFAVGWTGRAVPVVDPAVAGAAAGGVAAGAALMVAAAAALPPAVALAAAAVAGAAGAVFGPDGERAVTVRALVVAALDPVAGWPAPGSGRLRRCTIRDGRPVAVEFLTGPGWSRESLHAVAAAAATAGFADLVWEFDGRRRMATGAHDDGKR